MNACLSVWGVTALPIPARRAVLRTIRPAPCRSGRLPSAARKTGPSVVRTVADGQVDRPGGPRRQWDGDDLAVRVMISVRCPRSRPRCSRSAPVASEAARSAQPGRRAVARCHPCPLRRLAARTVESTAPPPAAWEGK